MTKPATTNRTYQKPCPFGLNSNQDQPDLRGENTEPPLLGNRVQESAVSFNVPPRLTHTCALLPTRDKKQRERKTFLLQDTLLNSFVVTPADKQTEQK